MGTPVFQIAAKELAPARRSAPIRQSRESDALAFSLLSPADIPSIESQWGELGRQAVEANPFFSSWMLAPALRLLGGEKVQLLCLWRKSGAEKQLVGLLPIEKASGYARLPASYFRSWIYPHCFYGAPLVRRGAETDFFAALFSFVDAAKSFGSFLRLRLLDCDGPLARGLAACARSDRIIYAAGHYERAVLHGGYKFDDFVAGNIRRKKMKEMQRRRKRLGDVAPLVFRVFREGDDLDQWIKFFIALEDSGWKSEAGTSFARNEAESEFLKQAVRGARAAGDLQFVRLDAGGAPVAMMINFARDGQSYGFKICHDEAYARFSPGVMIEMELLRMLETMTAGEFIDSCAASDHPMINSLWPARRRIAGYNIGKASHAGRIALGLCRLLEEANAWVRTA